jgi:hypothetical protein
VEDNVFTEHAVDDLAVLAGHVVLRDEQEERVYSERPQRADRHPAVPGTRPRSPGDGSDVGPAARSTRSRCEIAIA